MKRINLVLTMLMCCSVAQAVDKTADKKANQPQEKSASPMRRSNLKITVTVADKTITSLSLSELPKDAKVEMKATSISSKQANKPAAMQLSSTIKLSGKASIHIRQDDKELLNVAVEDGVITIEGLEYEADKFRQQMEGLMKSQLPK